MAVVAADTRGGVPGVTEENEIRQNVNGFCGRHLGLRGQRHRGVASLAFRGDWKCRAFRRLRGRVAVNALQLQRGVARMAELDRVRGVERQGSAKATSESE